MQLLRKCLLIMSLALSISFCSSTDTSSDANQDTTPDLEENDAGGLEETDNLQETEIEPDGDGIVKTEVDEQQYSDFESDILDELTSSNEEGNIQEDWQEEWDPGERPDFDPTQAFLLTVPPGSGLCTTFCEGRTWQEEYQMVGRIELLPGYYVLPRMGGTLDKQFILEILFGPQLTQLVSKEPGQFEVTYYFGAWWYLFQQDFIMDNNQDYNVRVMVWFEPSYWGLDWPEEVTLDGEFATFWVWADSRIGPGELWCEEMQGFTFQDLSAGYGPDNLGTTASGDWVLAEIRSAQACKVAGNTNCEEINRAEVNIQGNHQEITDPVGLIYSAGHHNANQRYLIPLTPPIGTAHFVLAEAPPMGETSGGALILLDANLVEIERQSFVSWQTSY